MCGISIPEVFWVCTRKRNSPLSLPGLSGGKVATTSTPYGQDVSKLRRFPMGQVGRRVEVLSDSAVCFGFISNLDEAVISSFTVADLPLSCSSVPSKVNTCRAFASATRNHSSSGLLRFFEIQASRVQEFWWQIRGSGLCRDFSELIVPMFQVRRL